ncbi:MAG: hypothetical protein QXH87_03465 [Candidatus Bathyarchaeia archaeon]
MSQTDKEEPIIKPLVPMQTILYRKCLKLSKEILKRGQSGIG